MENRKQTREEQIKEVGAVDARVYVRSHAQITPEQFEEHGRHRARELYQTHSGAALFLEGYMNEKPAFYMISVYYKQHGKVAQSITTQDALGVEMIALVKQYDTKEYTFSTCLM